MADYNSVPLGEAGTGAAFILPHESQAANYVVQSNQAIQQQLIQQQKDKQEKAQALAQSYKENAFKAKNGTLWNNELMALQQKHIQQGSDYAKQGIDIYNPNPNDPNQMAAHDQYMSDRQKLYNMQDVRDQIGKTVAEDHDTLAKAAVGKYDPDSIQAQHSFVTNNKLADVVNKGLELPRIQEAYDPATNIVGKLKEATSMTPETEFVHGNTKITSKQFKPGQTGKNIENLFINSPGGANYVQKQTGITPQDAKLIPDTLPEVTAFNDHQFRNTTAGQQAVAQAGITSYSSPQYQQLLQQKSQADLAAKQKYNGFIKQYVDLARSNASEVDKRVPDYSAEDQQFKRNADARAAKSSEKDDAGSVVYGNQESTVPVLKTTMVNGKVVPQNAVNAKGKPTTVNSSVEPEQGATLFSQALPQTKLMATPGHVVTLKDGHSVPNTSPFEVTAGSVKMEPVFNGLDAKDSRNGAVMSKRQLMEAVNGTGQFKLENISFQPMVYGDRPVKQGGKTTYEPVAFPYDAVRGNPKLKTAKFEETENNFKQLVNSPDFKNMTAQQRIDFLSKTFNIH